MKRRQFLKTAAALGSAQLFSKYGLAEAGQSKPHPSAATLAGVELSEAEVKELKASLRGELVGPGDDTYDAVRKVWNGAIDKRPALIVRCAGAADVIGAVNFARAHKLLVSVRGGGHNVGGAAVCDGGIMIDLSRMKSVRVDLENRTARADPGLNWGEFYQETQASGLATTGGVCSTPGIAGVTLGGGFGWLMRKYGLSCDNLLSADVVTADGRLQKASDQENADLFWGLRGGHGNFGVVTSLEYQLHPVGTVLSGMVLHPLSRAKDVLKFYREFADSAPEDLTAYAAFLVAPDKSPVVAILICYLGPSDAGENIVKPLRTFGPPAVDQIQTMTYLQCERMFDAANPAGRQNYWRSNLLSRLSDDAIDTLIAHFQSVPSTQSSVLIEHFGGAVSRIPKDATAFAHRDARHSFVILSMWSDPAESQQQIRWTDEFWQAMRPFSSEAVQVNYLGVEGPDRVKAAYGSNYPRLVALKKKYDPANLFRVNQNIQPAAGA